MEIGVSTSNCINASCDFKFLHFNLVKFSFTMNKLGFFFEGAHRLKLQLMIYSKLRMIDHKVINSLVQRFPWAKQRTKSQWIAYHWKFPLFSLECAWFCVKCSRACTNPTVIKTKLNRIEQITKFVLDWNVKYFVIITFSEHDFISFEK